jgi:hypothetical protein
LNSDPPLIAVWISPLVWRDVGLVVHGGVGLDVVPDALDVLDPPLAADVTPAFAM